MAAAANEILLHFIYVCIYIYVHIASYINLFFFFDFFFVGVGKIN